MNEFNYRLVTSIGLLITLYFSLINKIVLSAVLLILIFIAFFEFNNIFFRIFKKNKFLNFLILLITLFYLVTFSLFIWIFLHTENINNQILIIYVLSICISTDVGGYIFGKIFKGKKITKISPNKTYSGMIGSFLTSFIITFFLFINLDLKINIYIITLIISSLTQIGDLIISLLKRRAKIKDTGSFLPGHGGLLDRIDGILLALPIGIVLVSI